MKGLGKGFAALLADTEEGYNKLVYDPLGEGKDIKDNVVDIEIEKIEPNPNQPRKAFDNDALQELADSIKVHGVIMPIVLNKNGDKYMIIAGERRFRASKLAGKTTIPAVVRNYNERQIKEISLIENLQREDLNPIEAANAMKQLMDDYNITQEELATRIGKNRSTIANTLRLLTLDKEVIKMVESGELSQGHARALITLPTDAQKSIAKKIVSGKMNVREVEQQVKDYFNPPDKAKKDKKAQLELNMSAELKELINRMQRDFGTKVSAIGNDHKGRIYIDYFTRDDLDRIADLLDILENQKG